MLLTPAHMSLRAWLAIVPLLAACGGPDSAVTGEEEASAVYQGFTYPFVGTDGKPRIASLGGALACPDGSSSTVCVVDAIATGQLPIAGIGQSQELQAGLKNTNPSFGGATVLLKGQFLTLLGITPGGTRVTRTFQVSAAWVLHGALPHAQQPVYLDKTTTGTQGGYWINNLAGLQLGFAATVDWSLVPPNPGIVDGWVITGSSVVSGGWGSQVSIKADAAFQPYGVQLSL
jgi:hypothetical protein